MNHSQISEPTLRYIFAHISLKDFVFLRMEDFLNIFKAGPHNMTRFLKDYWNYIKEKHPELAESDIQMHAHEFDVSLSKLSNGQELLLVKLPKPVHYAEAYYAGILINPTPRYFTFELGQSIAQGNPDVYVVGEWDKDGKHKNYGGLTHMKPGLFVGKIDNILSMN